MPTAEAGTPSNTGQEGQQMLAFGCQMEERLFAHHQHRAGGVTHHGFRHAAHQQMAEAGATVAAHDQQIHLVFLRLEDDLVGGAAEAHLELGRDGQALLA